MNCLICGAESHGYHFGILACRACAAFFRRSVAEKKPYKCKASGACPVDKSVRSICRACRFQKCEQCGMNRSDVQLNRDPIGRKLDPTRAIVSTTAAMNKASTIDGGQPRTNQHDDRCCDTPYSYSNPQNNRPVVVKIKRNDGGENSDVNGETITVSNPPITLSPYLNTSSKSILKNLKQGFCQYITSQKAIYKVLFPDLRIQDDEFRLINQLELRQMKRGCNSLMFTMLQDFFHPFRDFDKQSKIEIIQTFAPRFILLETAYRSYLLGPKLAPTQWMVHYGHGLDFDNLGVFFIDPATREESIKMFQKVHIHITRLRKLFDDLEISDIEVAALTGLIFWNEVSFVMPTWTPCTEIQQQILSELHSYIINRRGLTSIGAKFGNIIASTHEINSAARFLTEARTIDRIFNQHPTDLADIEPYMMEHNTINSELFKNNL